MAVTTKSSLHKGYIPQRLIGATGDIADHAIVRGDGGGKETQGSAVQLDDSGNMTADGANQRIRDFGVAEVQSGTPATTATGMLWYDTDDAPALGLGVRDIVTITGNTTLTTANDVILVDASGGVITVTLPAAAVRSGKQFDIKKIDSSGNAVTVDGDGSETIDGATTKVISSQYDSVTIMSSGTEWFIL